MRPQYFVSLYAHAFPFFLACVQELEHRIWLIYIALEAESEQEVLPLGSYMNLSSIGLDANLEASAAQLRWGVMDPLTDFAALALPDDANSEPTNISNQIERRALDVIIGKLLTSGNIQRAYRLASQFHYFSLDVLVVHEALQLAQEIILPTELHADVVARLFVGDLSQLSTLSALRSLSGIAEHSRQCATRIMINYSVRCAFKPPSQPLLTLAQVAKVLNMTFKSLLSSDASKVVTALSSCHVYVQIMYFKSKSPLSSVLISSSL